MAVTAQDLQTQDDAYAKQAAEQQATKQTQETQAKQPPSLLQQWLNNPGRISTSTLDWAVSAADSLSRAPEDVGAGVATAAANTGDAAVSAVKAAGRAVTAPARAIASVADPATADQAVPNPAMPISPIWDHAKNSILDFRDAVAVSDPTLSDNLIQGAAQLAVPFAGYSRLLSGVHGFANVVAAGAATDATALGPHDPRMADLMALGRHVEGKLGDALRWLTPDGSAQNAYLNYLGDRTNESEAEGRWKNVLDGFGANLIATPLLAAAGSALKHGTAGLRYAIDNGVGSASDMVNPAAQRGSIDWRNPGGEASLGRDDKVVYDPNKARTDMSLSPEQRALERERVAAQRDREDGILPEFQPEPVPANAAAREGAAAQRAAADVSPLESDKALSFARTHIESMSGAGREGSLHDVVSSLAQHMDTSTEEGSFYKGLFDRISEKNLDTKLVPPGTGLLPSQENVARNIAGKNNSIDGTMTLYKRGFKDNDSFVHTLAHESVHAATVDAIDKQPAVRNALSELMNEAIGSPEAGKLGASAKYGFKNPKEFVAEIESNPTLQKAMKKATAEDGRPIWDHYKEVIGGIFGLSGAAIMHPQFEQILTGKKEKEKPGA